MNENNSTLIIVGGFVAVMVGIAVFLSASSKGEEAPEVASGINYDAFATCLKEKGAVFYGAFWCPHCQAQKKAFGNAARLLPYVECSNPDKTQTAACTEKKIESYPTWIFADGSQETGEVSMEKLSEKTSCVLPGATTPSTPSASTTPEVSASTTPTEVPVAE